MGDQAFHAWTQPRKGSCAVAQLMLDQRAQLTKSPVIFEDEEQRVIAEPRWSSRLAQ